MSDAVALIFQVGCRDNSTKESRVIKETDALSKLQKQNPKKVVLNKRGKATPIKKTNATSDGRPKQLPGGYISKLLKDLRQRGLAHNEECSHDAGRVNEAMRLVYGGPSQGGAQIAVRYDVSDETVVAAYSGYYRVDGETIFLHSDGSICRISETGTPVTCPCKNSGCIHG
jgi:hypothetical protein